VHDGVAVRTGGDIAWAIRKGARSSRRLPTIHSSSRQRTRGQHDPYALLKNAKYVKDAASESERKKFLALIQYFQKYGTSTMWTGY